MTQRKYTVQLGA